MIQKQDATEFSSGRGQKFDPAIPYEFSWTEYETPEEMVANKDEMSLEEQWKARNAQRQNKARNAAYNKKMDDLNIQKQTAENNEQVRLRDMFKLLMFSGKHTPESARKAASLALGIEWEE